MPHAISNEELRATFFSKNPPPVSFRSSFVKLTYRGEVGSTDSVILAKEPMRLGCLSASVMLLCMRAMALQQDDTASALEKVHDALAHERFADAMSARSPSYLTSAWWVLPG
jgi:hypothetical protein